MKYIVFILCFLIAFTSNAQNSVSKQLGSANITGNAGNITATTNSTLTSLPSLSLPSTQLSGTITNAQLAGNIDQSKITSLTTDLTAKQPNIQLKDEGTNIGTSGGVSNIDFTGTGVTATHSGGTVTVNIASGGGGGIADPGANGILARTALNTTTSRTITGTTNLIDVTNGDGVGGNPTLTVGSDVSRLSTAQTYAGVKTFSQPINLSVQSSQLTTAATNEAQIGVVNNGGRRELSWVGEFGDISYAQASLSNRTVTMWQFSSGTTIGTPFGAVPSTVGTISHPAIATTSFLANLDRWRNTSAATAAALAYNRAAANECSRGFTVGGQNVGGFRFYSKFGISTLQAGNRFFIGLTANPANNPTNVDPLTTVANAKIGIAFNTNTGNLFLVNNDGTAAMTTLDLGVNFPVSISNAYELIIYCPPNGSTIFYKVTNLENGTVASGSLTTNIPSSSTLLGRQVWMTNNATAASVSYDVEKIVLEKR